MGHRFVSRGRNDLTPTFIVSLLYCLQSHSFYVSVLVQSIHNLGLGCTVVQSSWKLGLHNGHLLLCSICEGPYLHKVQSKRMGMCFSLYSPREQTGGKRSAQSLPS